MSLLCIPIAVEASAEIPLALERAARARVLGARLIEWRCDGLADDDNALDAIARLVRESPLPSLVTIRSSEEGGTCALDENARLALLARVARASDAPRMIDVEFDAMQADIVRGLLTVATAANAEVTDPDAQPTRIVASSHDFLGRPTDLMRRVAAMQEDPLVSVVKIAWTARSVRDNLEAFDILSTRTKPTIALLMGEFGLMSRVLAPKFGGFLTFASDAKGTATAPGQPTVRELRDLYRFNSVQPSTKVLGVIGWPVAHSRSPSFHNARFREANYDGVFLPIPVPAEWEHFKATLGAIIDHEKLDFSGASVTLPHKEHLVRFVQERGGTVDADAAWLGAANTLLVAPDAASPQRKLFATNTDMQAAVEVLTAAFATRGKTLEGARIAVLGAGGVARAVAGGLACAGANVAVFNRTHERAQSVARDLTGRVITRADGTTFTTRVIARAMELLGCDEMHAIVNCTSVGMEGGDDALKSALPDEVHVDNTMIVMDTVYAPKITPFLRGARARGATCIDGETMFARQAELQSALFVQRW